MYRPTTSDLVEARRALEFGQFRLVDLTQSMKVWGPRSGLAPEGSCCGLSPEELRSGPAPEEAAQ
jgi:hypothetical protein